MFETFEDLPEWVKNRVERIRPNDARSWVFEPVPVLGNESIMSLMNAGEEGQNRIRRYFIDVAGKFFLGQ